MVGEGDAALLARGRARRVTTPSPRTSPCALEPAAGCSAALRHNVERRQGDVALFEVGTTFAHVASRRAAARARRRHERAREAPERRRAGALLLGRPVTTRAAPSRRGARCARRCASTTCASRRPDAPPVRTDALRDDRSSGERRGPRASSARSTPSSRPRSRLDPGRRLAGWTSRSARRGPRLARRRSEVAVVPSRFRERRRSRRSSSTRRSGSTR